MIPRLGTPDPTLKSPNRKMRSLLANLSISVIISAVPCSTQLVIFAIACNSTEINKLSRRIGKPTIYIGKNKGADQRLCFRYTDSTIPLLLKSEISSFYPLSVTVQAGLCQTWLEPKLLVFSRTGSIDNYLHANL